MPVTRSSGDTPSSPHVIPRCAKSRGGLNASDAPLAVLKKKTPKTMLNEAMRMRRPRGMPLV